jgi:putative PIN family toxin of toxin-antitoxin system
MAFLEQLRLRVRIVEPMPLSSPVSRDADDDGVLATAVAAGAAMIVTGDEDLLVIGRHNDIDIISPREFLSRLSS